MRARPIPLPWLEAGEDFPPVSQAWGPSSEAPGLLAAGGRLDTATLCRAYGQGIFPWFSAGQPILWWSPDPRMVLEVAQFRLHRSLRKTLRRFEQTPGCEIRFDTAFEQVIEACAGSPREGQDGTWILPPMVQAYTRLHQAGLAHSVETWIDGELAGGLYCINIGAMVYGESMFSRQSNASKIALAALVAFCRQHAVPLIDCQQETAHLALMGAHPIPRSDFCRRLRQAIAHPHPVWRFDPLYWKQLIPDGGAGP